VEGRIIPCYLALQRATANLDAFTERLCADPRTQRLECMRRLFLQVQSAWARIQHVGIGPVEVERRRYRIQLWPDKHGTAARQIRA
jgi:predicted lipoprotein